MDNLDLQLEIQKGDVDLKCRLEWLKQLNKFIMVNTKEELQEDFRSVCNRYAALLMDLWNLDNDGTHYWVNNEVGSVFLIFEGEYAITMDDIRFCVDKNAPFDAYKNWVEYCLKCDEYGFSTPTFKEFWCEECPLFGNDVFERLDVLKKNLEDAVEEYKKQGPKDIYTGIGI